MGQIRRVSQFIRRNAGRIQTALPFRGFFDPSEARFAKHLGEIAEIECGAVLSIAENEIRKPAAQRIEMPRKGIVEPLAARLSIRSNRALQARNDEPDAAAVFQHPHTFPKQTLELIRIEVLEHVGGVDRVHRIRRKWKSVSNIQPNVNLVKGIAVNIQETGQVFWTTTKMQMPGAVPRAWAHDVSAQEIIRNRGLGDAPKHDVFV